MSYRIAIIGGGPSALFTVYQLSRRELDGLSIDIYEQSSCLGYGMPYGPSGAGHEHWSNVSSDEVPPLPESLKDWIASLPDSDMHAFGMDKSAFHEKQVVPRLLLGQYLHAQFTKVIHVERNRGIPIRVRLNNRVCDISYSCGSQKFHVICSEPPGQTFDSVIICTGHVWPKSTENGCEGFFESPYPPSKLEKTFNHPVALKGSSLTAIDAALTLSKANGKYSRVGRRLQYQRNAESTEFQLNMFSLGHFPSVRFHIDQPMMETNDTLSDESIQKHKTDNNGFISLDFLFERNFKRLLMLRDNLRYRAVMDKNVEEFCQWVTASRMEFDPFALLKADYLQAEKSIHFQESIVWKELVTVLNATLNEPAKYFSAEDYLRFKNMLVPLISDIIGQIPQSSAEHLLALHEAGVLALAVTSNDSKVEVIDNHEIRYAYTTKSGICKHQTFKTFVDCTGQVPLGHKDLPFRSLLEDVDIGSAAVRFRASSTAIESRNINSIAVRTYDNSIFYLMVGGVAITDSFQLVLSDGRVFDNCFITAVPFISGFNPDYSGLDICHNAAVLIAEKIESVLTNP
ncbi:FAD/NAD(P)-binding protein [Alteromonas oceanisediminis]|uniref:FAD/NAD(P)-binding protein n=1 Tax=Alteromonas oceanisediminis TaxID=2836180 RepID=UPI001BD9FCFE|nr:FAD/NAD(P)-binding protein [Alteromonas oceanisediminis]MBT0587571.1 FAD/NAD(P)-binding protein [Alteromonas oceanisediminis]